MSTYTIIRGEGQEPLGVYIPGSKETRWQAAVKLAAQRYRTRPRNLTLWQVLAAWAGR